MPHDLVAHREHPGRVGEHRRRRAQDGPIQADAAAADLPGGVRRRAVGSRSISGGLAPARHRAGSSCPRGRADGRRSRRSAYPAAVHAGRALVRHSVSVRQARSHRDPDDGRVRDGERRTDHVRCAESSSPSPERGDAAIPAHRREPRRPRDRASVVRQPRHACVVGRHLAQRGVRHVDRREDRQAVAARLRSWCCARREPRGGDRRRRARHRRGGSASRSDARSDIFNAFDSITYEKGATVIGMFEAGWARTPFRAACKATSRPGPTGRRRPRTSSPRCRRRAGCRSPRHSTPSSTRTGSRRSMCVSRATSAARTLALTQHRLRRSGRPAALAALADPRLRSLWRRACRQVCTLMRTSPKCDPLGRACPAFVFANAGGRGYYVPDYREGARTASRVTARRCRSRSSRACSTICAGLRARGRRDAGDRRWRGCATARLSRDWNVLRAALDLAEFSRQHVRRRCDRPEFAAFAREVFGPRARALGFVPKPGESDDDQLSRRALLRFVAPYDPELAAQARRLALAWIADRKAVDAGTGRRRPCDGGAHRGRRDARGDGSRGEIDTGPARAPLPDDGASFVR